MSNINILNPFICYVDGEPYQAIIYWAKDEEDYIQHQKNRHIQPKFRGFGW